MKNYLLLTFIILVFSLAESDSFISNTGAKSAETDQLKPELVLQSGHSKAVQSVVVSPNGDWAVSGGFDNTIKIWELASGRELRSMTGHRGTVRTLALSSDGRWLASGGIDKTLRLWEVETGLQARSFEMTDASAETVEFSPDGKLLAAGTSGGAVTIRETAGWRELFELKEHTAGVTALAFSPDGKFLASADLDGIVRVWDVVTGKRIKNIKSRSGAINVLRFNKTADMLVSGGSDKSVRLFKVSNGRAGAVLTAHTGEVLALHFTDDGRLASADSNHFIKYWDPASGKEIKTAAGRADGDAVIEAEAAAFAGDGKFVVYGNGDRTVMLFDAVSGERRRTFENKTTGYYGAAFSPNGRWLAAAGFDNTVKLWDLRTGQGLPPLAGHSGFVTAVVFHPDNRTIISASVDHSIRLWDAVTEKPTTVLGGHKGSVSALSIGASGDLLASGGADRTVILWNPKTGSRTAELTGHTGEIISVSISPDEKLIASASLDKTIKIWDARAGRLLHTFEGHTEEVDAVDFSPDGRFLVSGSLDRTLRIWDVATGRAVRTLTGHTGKINTAAFSPDGSQIVSGGQDQTVRIWNAADGEPVSVLRNHSGAVFSLDVSSDGEWIASASEDGSIVIWHRKTGRHRATLVSLIGSRDWLVVSPEGFFDGSPAAWEQLFWRFEKNTFNVKSVEVFFNEFYSPGFLTDLLDGKNLPSAGDISIKDRRQPVLKISLDSAAAAPGQALTERQVSVKIAASEIPAGSGYRRGSGVRDIRLFRNGSLVKFWPGELSRGGGGSVELTATVSLVNGRNELTAYGFNHENIKSDNAELVLDGAPELKRKGVFYIIAVGVGKYANPRYDLNYVETDAREFGELLRARQAELKSFDRVEVVPLYNQEATKDNILSALAALAGADISGKPVPAALGKLKTAQPEDTVVLFFSGHGTSQNGHFYLLPYDLGYTDPARPLDAQVLKTVLSSSISDLELEQAFREVDAGHLLLVIDACNSGQALESEDERRGPMNTKGLAQLAYDKGMYILTASQSAESAYVSEALKRSYLSYALTVEALKTPVADTGPKDGLVSVREWFDYATGRVPQLRQAVAEKDSKPEQGKGLEEEDSRAGKETTQRPRVFYRRQNDFNSLIISQVR